VDYFQGVVTEFLRADRAVFVNPECMIQLDQAGAKKGRHWFCDVMAIKPRDRSVYLCEVTYSRTLHALLQRLGTWNSHWPEICHAISRDNGVPADWAVRPWIFIPTECLEPYKKKLPLFVKSVAATPQMPSPRVTFLEHVAPWKYPSERTDDYVQDDA